MARPQLLRLKPSESPSGLGAPKVTAALCLGLIVACKGGSETRGQEPPHVLLARLLYEADGAEAEIAARVASGVLAETSTETLETIGDRALRWASDSQSREALMEVAGELARRGASGPLERFVAGATPGDRETAQAAFIAAQARSGRLDGVLPGLERITAGEPADEARIVVVKALVDRGRIFDAVEHVDRFFDPSRRDRALLEVSRAHARAGRVTESLVALSAIRSAHERGLAEGELAAAEYDRGLRSIALKRARVIESRLVRAMVLADLGRLAHAAGRAREALRLFREAEAVADELEDPLLAPTALAHLAERLEDVGQEARAAELVDRLGAGALALVQAQRVKRLALRRRLDEARRALEALAAPASLRSEAAGAVAILEARGGALDAALERAAAIGVPPVRWRTLGAISAVAPEAEVTEGRLASIARALRDGV